MTAPDPSTRIDAAPERRPGAAGWIVLALLLPYLALCVAGALQTGTSWDESEHRRYGELALDFYASLGHARAAVTDKMHYYGALHAIAGALAERALPFLGWPAARHLATVAFGLLALVYAVRLARLLGGPRAGFLAALLLVATPRWTGDAFYNPIDVPSAGVFALALFHLARIAVDPARARTRDWVLFGLGTGLTLAVRTLGLLLFVDAAFALGVWALFVARPRGAVLRASGARVVARVVARLVLAGVVAAAAACAFWPRLLVEPFTAVADSLAMTNKFPWTGTVFFRGQNVSGLELPRSYLPVWLGLTTPLATMLGLALGLIALARRRLADAAPQRIALVAFAVLFPLAYAVASRATLYDGIRHFLFVLPPLSALAALGWSGVIAGSLARTWRLVFRALLVAAVAEPLAWCARLHPLEYVYFNPFAGGLARASQSYETDYWGLSLRAAAEWLSAFRKRSLDPERVLVVGTNAPWHLLEPWLDDPSRYRSIVLYTVADVRTHSFDLLLLSYRFQNFRLKGTEPLAEERLVEGQVPFWQIYAGPTLASDGGAARDGR